MDKELSQAFDKRRELEKEAERAKEYYDKNMEEWELLEHVLYPNGEGTYEFYHEWRMDIRRKGHEMLERWDRVLECGNYIDILLDKRKK